MNQVLLFYQYCDILDVQAIHLWQKALCEKLGLLGRVLLASEGINGTLCGSPENTKKYIKEIKKYPLFSSINFKKSISEFLCFDSLQVKIKKEIVILEEDTTFVSYKNSAPRLTPEQFHQELTRKYEEKREDVIIFDARNAYESRIGRFQGALCPAIQTSRQFKDYFQKNREMFAHKKVLMYCTGGVRCERISVLCQQNTDACQIYHLENGIHAYAEQYFDGYFRGKNYVFDDRISMKVTDDILTTCDLCNAQCDLYNNCRNAICNKHHISCDQCYIEMNACCSEACQELVSKNKTIIRAPLKSRSYLGIL